MREPLPFTQTKGITPSGMEAKIAILLQDRNVKYFQEVIFEGCVNPLTGIALRYDFYLPELNILVEYDGRLYHVTDEVRARDKVKDKFARQNKINIVRLKNRADVVMFFNSSVFKVGYAAKIATKPTQKSKKEKPAKQYSSVAIMKEIEYLEALKSESKQDYALRLKYLKDNRKSLFNKILEYYRNKKAA